MNRFLKMLRKVLRPWEWFKKSDPKASSGVAQKGIPIREIYNGNTIWIKDMVERYGFTKEEAESFDHMAVSRKHFLVKRGNYYLVCRSRKVLP